MSTISTLVFSLFSLVLIRQRLVARSVSFPVTVTAKSNKQFDALIRERFLTWKETKRSPLVDPSRLHPDLVKLIHVDDAAVITNSPPSEFEDVTPVARQVLSGITPTVSTLPGAFLPSRHALLQSFRRIREFSLLSEGGRAFTKHCHRCTSGWWGSAKGPASKVNATALHKVNEILDNASWKNVFYLPGDRPVCEFRVKEGYGARWAWSENEDELAFRGFLEPPQGNGHEVGWKH